MEGNKVKLNLTEKQISKLTDKQKGFYEVIKSADDSKKDVELSVVQNSEDVLVAEYETGTIDISDMDAYGVADVHDKFSVFGHETAEQQYKKENNLLNNSYEDYLEAHNEGGKKAEKIIDGYSRDSEDFDLGSNFDIFGPRTGTAITIHSSSAKTVEVRTNIVKNQVINVQRKDVK
jgi:hypothetical protein